MRVFIAVIAAVAAIPVALIVAVALGPVIVTVLFALATGAIVWVVANIILGIGAFGLNRYEHLRSHRLRG